MQNRDQPFLIAGLLLLSLTILAAYSPLSQAGFILDDKPFYIADPIMEDPDGLLKIWLHPQSNNDIWPYIPITRSTFWLERQWGGMNLRLSHSINIFLHLLSALILWFGLRHFHFRGAFWVGLLFGLHPIYVQSVAWIAERKNGVAGVFFLLTFFCFLLYEKNPSWKKYAIVLALFLCAALSKSSTLMLPVLFIFGRLWIRASWKISDFLKLLPFFLIALGLAYLRIWFEIHSFNASEDLFPLNFLERLLTAGQIPFFYIRKLLWPDPLLFTYPKWKIESSHLSMYLPLISILIVAVLSIRKYQIWSRSLFLALGAFLVSLFPVLSFFNNSWTQFSFVADHWMHLPSLPLLILIVQGTLTGIEKSRLGKMKLVSSMMTGLGGLLFFIMAIKTWQQSQSYLSSKTLWQTTLAHNGEAWLAHQELGREYSEENKPEKALFHLNRAIELNPFRTDAYNNRGNTFFQLQQYQKAIEDFNNALKLNPKLLEAYYNRGKAYAKLGQAERAFSDYNQTLKLDPGYAKAYHNRGTVHAELQQYVKALQDFNRAIQLAPEMLESHYNKGLALIEVQQFDQAIRSFDQALRLNPQYTDAYNKRAYLYYISGNEEEACLDWEAACRLGDCLYHQRAIKKNFCSIATQ
ncbi:MAG: tetratricopeptide repeat protein [SAR324 cluster bacterium]|nr:tetratricopeptide repeat protein [SAR324 cluster bacterium]